MDIGFRMFQLMHRFRRMCLPERLHMLPRSEHMVLSVLHRQEGQALSCACVAQTLHVTAPAISRTMRHLREHGLIEMETDTRDRRGTRVRLTDAGRRALEREHQRIEQVMQRAAARLKPGELEHCFDTFDRFYESLALEMEAWEKEHSKEAPCEVYSEN